MAANCSNVVGRFVNDSDLGDVPADGSADGPADDPADGPADDSACAPAGDPSDDPGDDPGDDPNGVDALARTDRLENLIDRLDACVEAQTILETRTILLKKKAEECLAQSMALLADCRGETERSLNDCAGGGASERFPNDCAGGGAPEREKRLK